MPETEQQDSNLSELVVKEAIGIGMDSSMREPILEAVRDAEGDAGRSRGASMLGAGVALGAAAGYLLGSRGERLSMPSEGLSAGEELAGEGSVVEEVTEQVAGGASGEAPDSDSAVLGSEAASDSADGSGSGRLGRLAMVVGIVAAVALVRRRLGSGEAEEWEPIEDFESTVESAAEEAEEATGEAEEEEGEMAEADADDDADEE